MNPNKRPKVAKAVVLASAGPGQHQHLQQLQEQMQFMAPIDPTGQDPGTPLMLPQQYAMPTNMPATMMQANMMQSGGYVMGQMSPMPQPTNPYMPQQQNWQQQP